MRIRGHILKIPDRAATISSSYLKNMTIMSKNVSRLMLIGISFVFLEQMSNGNP